MVLISGASSQSMVAVVGSFMAKPSYMTLLAPAPQVDIDDLGQTGIGLGRLGGLCVGGRVNDVRRVAVVFPVADISCP